ncbi:peroxiredoxin-2E-2 [Pyrus ussuriensis x Pyrus communis]|uniref:Peroxiredoxin-2E-2 n=1 Tax=Pyrus ussuriensis x Pyrus communis TaxID=2448454 RepID=A0A5N5FPX8_9ROSA|nr:peroxiredoxin-2E-2 [Pyrus ussuriensis x Pyrus communis]
MMRGGGEQREREDAMGGRGAMQSERGEGKDGRKDYRMVKKATLDPRSKQWIGGCDAVRSRLTVKHQPAPKAWKENLNIGNEVLLLPGRDSDFRRAIEVELDFSNKLGKMKPPIGGLACVGCGSVGLILEWG